MGQNLDDQSWMDRQLTVEGILRTNAAKMAHSASLESELMNKFCVPRQSLALVQ